MATINYLGSLRYGPSGKRRKDHALKKIKRKVSSAYFEPYKPSSSAKARIDAMNEHTEKYPSYVPKTNVVDKGTKEDNSYKQEISKGYTIAPAYNKGAYQVIGKNNIKDIGR